MLKGIHLTLMIGPTVPVPVPRVVLDALTDVEVHSGTDGPSGFQLKFTLGNRSPLQTMFLIPGGAIPATMRVVLVATVNGTPEVLVDGVITDHQVAPGAGGNSTLIITGEDLTRLLDLQEINGLPYPATTTAARIVVILAKYLQFGIIPIIIPAFLSDVENPFNYVPLQQGTDLTYIKSLADRVGHVFYIEPGPVPLTNKAYWGPEIKTGIPQPALTINLDAHTNCESLSFQINNHGRVQPFVTIHEPITKFPIPIPIPTNVGLLNPPLGVVQPTPQSFQQVEGTSHLPPMKALLKGFAVASKSADAVTARGTLDVSRYGRPLKARRLVGVRGAGTAFDGLYFVRKVTHQIQRGSYKQSFELSRNGLVSTVPKVPV